MKRQLGAHTTRPSRVQPDRTTLIAHIRIDNSEHTTTQPRPPPNLAEGARTRPVLPSFSSSSPMPATTGAAGGAGAAGAAGGAGWAGAAVGGGTGVAAAAAVGGGGVSVRTGSSQHARPGQGGDGAGEQECSHAEDTNRSLSTQIWHLKDSQANRAPIILSMASAFRQKSSKPCKVFPLRSEVKSAHGRGKQS